MKRFLISVLFVLFIVSNFGVVEAAHKQFTHLLLDDWLQIGATEQVYVDSSSITITDASGMRLALDGNRLTIQNNNGSIIDLDFAGFKLWTDNHMLMELEDGALKFRDEAGIIRAEYSINGIILKDETGVVIYEAP